MIDRILDDLETIAREHDYWDISDEDILLLVAEVMRLRKFEELARETQIFK